MRQFIYTTAALAFSLTLAATAHAQGRGGHGGGHAGGGRSIGGSTVRGTNVGGINRNVNTTINRSTTVPVIRTTTNGTQQSRQPGPSVNVRVNLGGLNGTPRGGRFYSYGSRRGCWGPCVWNAACGCNCYYDSECDCYYYYCAPDNCYYPLDYCPYGRYDYQEP
jgi:hypothetical protein